MHSYHVYFNAKPDISRAVLVEQVHSFMRQQIAENNAAGYRLLHMKDKASFKDIPDFHLIVDYTSEATLNQSFANMKILYKEEPHRSLMHMVSGFLVAFSIDEIHAEQDAAANP